jgi:outer membrane protein OmpA-like peptidoglycan-associated protein
MKLLFSNIFLLVSVAMIAQGGQMRKASDLYENMAYAEAIEVYQKLDDHGVEDPEVVRNLAYSYWKVRDFGMAEQYFSRVMENSWNPEDSYVYAEALKSNGKYDEAAEIMKSYHESTKSDRRAKMQIENADYVTDIMSQQDRFTITNTSLSTGHTEFCGAIYKDELVFVSSRNEGTAVKRTFKWTDEPFLDLFTATIDNTGGLSGIKLFEDPMNTRFHEGPLTFSADGNTVYFTRNNFTDGVRGRSLERITKLKIYVSKRSQTGWSDPTEFKHNSDQYSTGHPTLNNDGTKLYFTCDKPGGFGGTDIYMSRMTNGEWSSPVNLGPGINTEGNEMFPFIHTDGTLYFSSDGHPGLGGLDVFEASQKDGFFYKVENTGYPLNSGGDDFGILVNPEKDRGYVSSNRGEGQGKDDIYYFTMKAKKTLSIEGKVIDEDNNEPLAGATIELLNNLNEVIERVELTEDGAFAFNLDRKDCSYAVRVTNGDKWTTYTSQNTPCDDPEGVIDIGEIPLSTLRWSAKGTMYTKSTNIPLEGVMVRLTDKNTGEVYADNTKANGSVLFKLEKDRDYYIRFEKEGFFAKTGMFSTVNMEPGVIEINKYIDLAMEEIILNKGIKIENIYYDYNKSYIRKDAAVELDKIRTLLIDNPAMHIELGSHTDARGSDTYNMSLSKKRAKAAMGYLIKQGIESERVTYQGYGETSVINKCENGVNCSDELHEENRRTEFKVTSY